VRSGHPDTDGARAKRGAHPSSRETDDESFSKMRRGLVLASALAAFWAVLPLAAQAADKVRVGVFPVASSLPLFVAQDRASSRSRTSRWR
jgi:hypothetical protein